MTNTLLSCPICHSLFQKEEHSYVCQNHHSFDISKQGYVNLLQNFDNKNHGDNKEMMLARRAFLHTGFYEFLAKEAQKTIEKYMSDSSVILDAGCGEGYYTNFFVQSKKSWRILGIDASKEALKMAAKQVKGPEYACASVYHLPLPDSTVDMVALLFSPLAREEYLRVLKPGGYLMEVIPGEDHLFGLKQAIYQTPYKNDVKEFVLEGFTFKEEIPLRKEVTIRDTSVLESLFKMTPYYYRTSQEDHQKIQTIKELTTPFSFHILVYQKGESS